MSKYYYASASLPMLIYGKDPLLTEQAFLDICESVMSTKELNIVKSCKLPEFLPGAEKNQLSKKYWNYERNLRNELAKMRADLLEIDYTEFIRDGESDPFVNEVALNALKQDSPYEAEQILDSARWQYVDDLSVNHFADLDFFTGYYIKLQIAIRQSTFDIEKGKENYSTAYQQIIGGLDEKLASGEEI